MNRRRIAPTVVALTLSLLLGVPACQTQNAADQAPAAVRPAGTSYLSSAETERLKSLLPGPFPRAPGAAPEEAASMERQLSDAEVQLIRAMQDDTSAQARARADRVEGSDPVWDFALVLGPHFNPFECPRIAHLMDTAAPEVAAIKDAAKQHFQRPRPPGSGLSTNDSYPSGHSTRAWFRARMLAEIAPDQADELIRQARIMVLNRMIVGKHHPSDCAGGIVLGSAIAESMIAASADPGTAVHHDLQAAKAEWAALRAKTGVPGPRM